MLYGEGNDVYFIYNEQKIFLTKEEKEKLNQPFDYEIQNGQIIFIERENEVFITIKIPLQVLMGSAELKQKLLDISLLFSDIKRTTKEGYVILSNIYINYVPEFLQKQEYEQLKSVGVQFSDEVDVLFANDTEDNVETA